jgi:hypothetical protein
MAPFLKWEPFEDLPDGWRDLGSRELRSLSAVWLEQKEVLAGSDSLRRFNERLQREWAIETGIIERVYTLDRGITELLIERGIDASLIPAGATDRDPNLVASIIADQEEALDWLFDVVAGRRSLSTSYVKELHSLMTRNQATATARDHLGRAVEVELLRGEWKRWPNNPTRPDGLVHEYCPPEQVPPEMDRLLDLHRAHEERGVAPEVEAAWLHHRFTQIHPFQEGNGRVARALASLVLIKAGWFPLVVTDAVRTRYLDTLEAADLGDLGPLVDVVASLERRAFVQALALAEETARDRDRVQQVVSSIEEIFARRNEERRREWERTKDLAHRVHDAAKRRFEEVADDLAARINPLSPGSRFFADEAAHGVEKGHYWAVQTLEMAHRLDVFANWDEYKSWVRLGLRADPEADILLVLTAIGREYRGLIGGAVCFFRREEVEGGRREIVDLALASDELFQFNYKDDEAELVDRFGRWLEQSLLRALEMWRQQLPYPGSA